HHVLRRSAENSLKEGRGLICKPRIGRGAAGYFSNERFDRRHVVIVLAFVENPIDVGNQIVFEAGKGLAQEAVPGHYLYVGLGTRYGGLVVDQGAPCVDRAFAVASSKRDRTAHHDRVCLAWCDLCRKSDMLARALDVLAFEVEGCKLKLSAGSCRMTLGFGDY